LGKFTSLPLAELTGRAYQVHPKTWQYLDLNHPRVQAQRIFKILSIPYTFPGTVGRATAQKRKHDPIPSTSRGTGSGSQPRLDLRYKIPKTERDPSPPGYVPKNIPPGERVPKFVKPKLSAPKKPAPHTHYIADGKGGYIAVGDPHTDTNLSIEERVEMLTQARLLNLQPAGTETVPAQEDVVDLTGDDTEGVNVLAHGIITTEQMQAAVRDVISKIAEEAGIRQYAEERAASVDRARDDSRSRESERDSRAKRREARTYGEHRASRSSGRRSGQRSPPRRQVSPPPPRTPPSQIKTRSKGHVTSPSRLGPKPTQGLMGSEIKMPKGLFIPATPSKNMLPVVAKKPPRSPQKPTTAMTREQLLDEVLALRTKLDNVDKQEAVLEQTAMAHAEYADRMANKLAEAVDTIARLEAANQQLEVEKNAQVLKLQKMVAIGCQGQFETVLPTPILQELVRDTHPVELTVVGSNVTLPVETPERDPGATSTPQEAGSARGTSTRSSSRSYRVVTYIEDPDTMDTDEPPPPPPPKE
jgi:hypothetical protein